MSSTTSYPVHIGLWTNWSYGPILGRTLTVTGSDGTLIVAFVAFFVTLIGSRIWRIICFILHNFYSTSHAQDALHNQRQAVLRNSASPVGGVWELTKLTLAWRNARVQSSIRLLPLVFCAAVIVCALAIASGFSSKALLRSEVLIAGDQCGVINEGAANGQELMLYLDPFAAQSYEMAANYAQRCYKEETQTSDCGLLIKRSLPMAINSHADCPFRRSLCLSSDSNVFLDSGLLDSHKDLGINSPSESRFQYRQILHCAPLATAGYKTNTTDRFNRTYTRYQYGAVSFKRPDYRLNSTFAVPIDTLKGSQKTLPETIGANFAVDAATASYQNGSLAGFSGFIPIADFNRTDAELDLIALSADLVPFLNKSTDLWYRATSPLAVTRTLAGKTENSTFWLPDEPLWPMGCVTQRQFCNPSLPRENRCTDLGSGFDVAPQFEKLPNGDPGQKASWAISGSSLHAIINVLRTQSLTSRFGFTQDKMQATLEPDQWQLDVINWFSITLALLQFEMLDRAAGPALSNPKLEPYISKPVSQEQKSICRNQKIYSTDYMSFSFFGLLFILIFGVFVTLLSLTIDSLASWIQQRMRLSPYARLEWKATYQLHLQRLVYEEVNYGQWRNGFLDVPVTGPGEKLAVFDVSDLETGRLVDSNHPTFVQDEEAKGTLEDVQTDLASSAQVHDGETGHRPIDGVSFMNGSIEEPSSRNNPATTSQVQLSGLDAAKSFEEAERPSRESRDSISAPPTVVSQD